MWRGVAFVATGSTYGDHNFITPTSVPINGQNYPAFQINFGPNAGKIFLAADADGDGIADAGLYRLPIGQLNGVTYYAAMRIVDNNSAIKPSISSLLIVSGSGDSSSRSRLMASRIPLMNCVAS